MMIGDVGMGPHPLMFTVVWAVVRVGVSVMVMAPVIVVSATMVVVIVIAAMVVVRMMPIGMMTIVVMMPCNQASDKRTERV